MYTRSLGILVFGVLFASLLITSTIAGTVLADSKSPPSSSSSCGTAFDNDCDGVSSNFTYDSGTGTYTRDYDDNDSSVGAYPGS